MQCSVAIVVPRRPDGSMMLSIAKREVDTTPAAATISWYLVFLALETSTCVRHDLD